MGSTTLLEQVTTQELLEVATQGPPGPPGVPGAPGGATEESPVFTYVDDVLVRVDYASGNHRSISYEAGRVSRVDYVRDGVTYRRTMNYNPDGTLAAVVDTVV